MRRKIGIAGMSLVELMTVAGIVGILGTLVLPRYKQLMVLSHRGEAKSNLTHIVSLQEIYKIDHFNYYSGRAMTGGSGIGYKDGNGSVGINDCDTDPEQDAGSCNHLGFRPDDLDNLRYLYRVSSGGHLALAAAASDTSGRWIYPDCDGAGRRECGYPSGDVMEMHVSSVQPRICRNISRHCGASGGASPPPPSGGGVSPITCSVCCPWGWSNWSSWTPPAF